MDEHEKTDRRPSASDRYWQDFVRSGSINDYLRYALGCKDE